MIILPCADISGFHDSLHDRDGVLEKHHHTVFPFAFQDTTSVLHHQKPQLFLSPGFSAQRQDKYNKQAASVATH